MKNKIDKILNIFIIPIVAYLLFFTHVRLTTLSPRLGESVPIKLQIASFNGLSIALGVLAAIVIAKLLLSRNRIANNVGKGVIATSLISVYIFALFWSLVAIYALVWLVSNANR